MAGSAVAVVGIATVVRVRRSRDLPLAALPLLLGAHQLVESVVWRGTEGTVSAGTASLARSVWAVIALVVLPLLVPLSVVLASRSPVPRRLLWLLAVGCFTSGVLAYDLTARPVTAKVHGHVLEYGVGVPWLSVLLVAYVAATVGSLLASDDHHIHTLGIWFAVGAAICSFLWRVEFASTWCAFAAVVSVLVLRWTSRQGGFADDDRVRRHLVAPVD